MDINSFFNFVANNPLGLNWIDLVIIILIAFYAVEGYFLGFFASLIDLISFIFSFVFGLSFYSIIAKFLVVYLHTPQGFANAIGFLVLAIVSEIILNVILKKFLFRFSVYFKIHTQKSRVFVMESVLGILPGALSAVILSAFILSLIITLPFSVFLKRSVNDSKIGRVLVLNTQGFAKSLNQVFGGAVNDTLSFLTIEPKSNKSVNLNFKTKNLSTDIVSENEMFSFVNSERVKRGLSELSFSQDLTNVGRDHCKDMLERGYFSHNTPEGLTPFDRMAAAGIAFKYGGENLALAPNSSLAMKGLMESEGHKANILSKDFKKLGVGAIDGGVYGIMFCQEFTD
ncbi:MAG: hypothetical protein COU25_03480 [Candidatus Levybacteria bacterium CG10_big_fil_rev_8_21_14_0_10_35_13]|nr:MAG: hypothetical protein COU25_03480 [Candidatus Levybacteria bacterium CG10_big_fil_rev_8_21_14_0_10_35_13]